MSVNITAEIFTGNMGDGWRDDLEAAEDYGAALENAFWDYVLDEATLPDDQEVHITITARRASGASRGVEVASENLSWKEEEALCAALRQLAVRTWDQWAASAAARALYSTDDV